MHTLNGDLFFDVGDLADMIRPRRKTVIDRLVGRLAVGQIFGEQFLYEVHGPFVAPGREPARRPLTTRLIEALSRQLRGVARQVRLRRAANELSCLHDRLLKDMGITRSEIGAAVFGAPVRGSDV
jgi:uncharacterized protein YjiS (DUF1127 family)